MINDYTGSGNGSIKWENKTYVSGIGMVNLNDYKNKTYISGVGMVDLDEYKNKTYVAGIGMVDNKNFAVNSPVNTATMIFPHGVVGMQNNIALATTTPKVDSIFNYTNVYGTSALTAFNTLTAIQPKTPSILDYTNVYGSGTKGDAITQFSALANGRIAMSTKPVVNSILNYQNVYGAAAVDQAITGSSETYYSAIGFPTVGALNKRYDRMFTSVDVGPIQPIGSTGSFGDTVLTSYHHPYATINPVRSISPITPSVYTSYKDPLSIYPLGRESNQWIYPVGSAVISTLAKRDYTNALDLYTHLKVNDRGDLVYRPFHETVISPAPAYEPPTVSDDDIEINEILVYKLGIIHSSIKESYLGAVHVLNSKGPDYVVHMACSLRRTFSFVIDKLPAKGAITDYIARNEEKFKAAKYNTGVRNRISRAAFLFFTEKNPSHLTEDEFMDLIKTCNTWVHDYTEDIPEYELAVSVYERSVDILHYILECYEAVRN